MVYTHLILHTLQKGCTKMLHTTKNPSFFYLVREHFSSPLLQMADDDAGKTFELVECPSKLIGYLPLLNDLRSWPFDETLTAPYSKRWYRTAYWSPNRRRDRCCYV